jgi:hypothetical protein
MPYLAQAYHDIMVQTPPGISVLAPMGESSSSLQLPIHAYRFSNEAYQAGIEEHAMDGVLIKFYCVEKTLADCFKFRNRIGMDVVLEALKLYKVRMKFNHGELLKFARICRVENVMRPYLEAMI